MTPRSSGPGGEYPPLRGTTNLRLTANQHCNVTENCAGVLAGATSPAKRSRLSYRLPGSLLESRPCLLLASAEVPQQLTLRNTVSPALKQRVVRIVSRRVCRPHRRGAL